jgi:hypothetical protein
LFKIFCSIEKEGDNGEEEEEGEEKSNEFPLRILDELRCFIG